MKPIMAMVLTAALAVSGNFALAQGGGGAGGGAAGGATGGATGSAGSSIGGSSMGGTSGLSSPSGATTSGTTTGMGNHNPGVGDLSDPSVRANPGLDANGPCNGARSTSGNNTPSC